MSRAFVNEDSEGGRSHRNFDLPPRSDPQYDQAAAVALLEASLEGDTEGAEIATGYYWGELKLRPHVERILERATAEGNAALARAAERFL